MWVVQLGIFVAADPLPLMADRKGENLRSPVLFINADFNILNEPLIQWDSATESLFAQTEEGLHLDMRVRAYQLLPPPLLLLFLWGGIRGLGRKGQEQDPFFFSQSDNSEYNQMESLNGKYVYKSK